jgi:lipopolysaccharide export system permease protein
MFRIVDRYVLRQILTPLLAALVISLLMLLAGRMLGFLDVTLGKKNSFTAVFKMLAYLTPNYLGLAVPAALYLGILFGFNRMSKTREIDAMMAAGIGLNRLFVPVLGLSALLMLGNLVAIGWMQPYGRYSYRAVIYNLTNVEAFELAREGIFMKSGTRTFIVDSLNQRDNSFEHLFVFDDKGQNGGIETVTASHGQLLNTGQKSAPVLRLDDGARLRINPLPDLNSATVLPRAIDARFQSADFPLDQVASQIFRERGADERELTLSELLTRQANPPEGTTHFKMMAELHNRILKMLAIPMLALLAVPFALSRARAQDAYRFGIAVVLLVSFNVVIEQGAIATSLTGLSPWISMWLPFLLFTGLALFRFWQACFVVSANKVHPLADVISRVFESIKQRAAR